MITFVFFSLLMLGVTFGVFGNPVSLGGLLIFLSFLLVCLLNLISSAWYGYILFLIYIGGLLVLFMYMCMISSNVIMDSLKPHLMSFVFLSAFLVGIFLKEGSFSSGFLGKNSFLNGSGLVSDTLIFLFISLVCLLLAIFLAVVHVTGTKGSLLIGSIE